MPDKKYKLKKDFPAIGGLEKDKEYKEVEFPRAWRHMFEEVETSNIEHRTSNEKDKDKKIKTLPDLRKEYLLEQKKTESKEDKNLTSESEETDIGI